MVGPSRGEAPVAPGGEARKLEELAREMSLVGVPGVEGDLAEGWGVGGGDAREGALEPKHARVQLRRGPYRLAEQSHEVPVGVTARVRGGCHVGAAPEPLERPGHSGVEGAHRRKPRCEQRLEDGEALVGRFRGREPLVRLRGRRVTPQVREPRVSPGELVRRGVEQQPGRTGLEHRPDRFPRRRPAQVWSRAGAADELKDPPLYDAIALVDAIRVGSARERQVASGLLERVVRGHKR